MRVPFGSSKTSARSCGQNSPSMPPSGVTFTVWARTGKVSAALKAARAAIRVERFMATPPLLCEEPTYHCRAIGGNGKRAPAWLCGSAGCCRPEGSGVTRFRRNLRLDETGKQPKRFLPAEIAGLQRNDRGYAFLHDVQLGSAGHLLQRHRNLHLSG